MRCAMDSFGIEENAFPRWHEAREVRDLVLPSIHETLWVHGPQEPNDTLTVANAGRRVVGYLVGEFIANKYATVMELAVLPEYRSQGISKGLIHSFASQAEERSCTSLYVRPILGDLNRRAELAAYYHRLGFNLGELQGHLRGHVNEVLHRTAHPFQDRLDSRPPQ